MKKGICTIALAAAAGLTASAHADLAFSFADPTPGRQLTANAGDGLALLSYDPAARLAFLVDGSTEPSAFEAVFGNARLHMKMGMGSATTAGGVTTASVFGTFVVVDADAEPGDDMILSGHAQEGAFVRIGGTSSILFSSETGFAYTAGPRLAALLASDRHITDPMEAVFTVTGIVVGGGLPLVGPGGAFNSFTANASFSGNSAVETRQVPTPGAAILAGAGTLLVARRRRK